MIILLFIQLTRGLWIAIRFRQLNRGGSIATADRSHSTIVRFGRKKDTGHGGIISLRNGVELVIVTAGASDRDAKEGLGHGIDLFISHIHRELARILFAKTLGTNRQEAGSNGLFCSYLFAGSLE